jgi:hypothetical protein
MNRLPVIATMAAGLLIAGLPPAVAAAAPTSASCTQWGFNGSTSLTADDSTLSFDATGASIKQGTFAQMMTITPPSVTVTATQIGAGGLTVPPPVFTSGFVTGGIGSDGQIEVTFSGATPGSGGGEFRGQVGSNGSAQGTTDDGAKWRTGGSSLKCLSTTTAGTPAA